MQKELLSKKNIKSLKMLKHKIRFNILSKKNKQPICQFDEL